MTRSVKEELGPILEAIREVEESLACRANRQGGALMILWGVIAALIAAFYQAVVWNPAPYHAALGPLLPWVWLAPMAVGYVAAVLAGLRMRREDADPAAARERLLDVAPGIVAGVTAGALSALGLFALIPGALLVGFALSLALRVRRAQPRMRSPSWGFAGLALVAGVALLVAPVSWSWLVMGALIGGSLVVLGRLRMRLAAG